jgi:phosphoribosylanthranilate isomerase
VVPATAPPPSAPARSTWVKICGVTVPDDAAAVAAAGAHYVGINCWPESRRFVAPTRVALLAAAARAVAPQIQVVGLFVDAYIDEIEQVDRDARFDILQLHGDEPIEQVRAIAARLGRAIWKAVPLGDEADLATVAFWASIPEVTAIVLDAPSAGRGGSGKRIDPALAAAAVRAHPDARFVLAGGLAADNVAEAIATIGPWAVDVASGVELAPGLKDRSKVDAFLAAARERGPELPAAATPVVLPVDDTERP